MSKTKSISGENKGVRPVDCLILLLFVLAAALLLYLFIESLQTSRHIKEQLNNKTSITR